MKRAGLLLALLIVLPLSDGATERLRRALALLDAGQPAAAAAELAPHEDRLEARSQLALGVARHRGGDLEGAARSFRRAAQGGTGEVERRARFNLARTQHDRVLRQWPASAAAPDADADSRALEELLCGARGELQGLLLESPADRDVRESLEAVSFRLASLRRAGQAARTRQGAQPDDAASASQQGSAAQASGAAGGTANGTGGPEGGASGSSTAGEDPGSRSLPPRVIAELRRELEAIETEALDRQRDARRRLPPAGGRDW